MKDTKNKRNRHAYITAEIREMLTCRYSDQSKKDKVFGAAYVTIRANTQRAAVMELEGILSGT